MSEHRPLPRVYPEEQLRQFVLQRVTALQERYLAGDHSAIASLARLRRCVGGLPGDDPRAWAETLEGLPEDIQGKGDLPTRYEANLHNVLTLYATHQQSKQSRMHVPGVSVGDAARRLSAQGTFSEAAVLRRFHQLGTATTPGETLQHLRGVVNLCRSQDVPLDYALLSRDLLRLQRHDLAPGVRLRWGRDYYRTTHENTPSLTTPTGESA